ncbi:MAG: helix-turn-helix domain-containing protein [Sciscionella sp.]
MTILLREAIGDRLRHARTSQHRTLREISRVARVSLGYLSEVERGQKEASSELLAAICVALELPLSELMYHVAEDIGALQGVEQADAIAAPLAEQAQGGERTTASAGAGSRMEGGRLVTGRLGTELAELRLQPMLGNPLSTSLSTRDGVVAAA